MLGEAVDGVDRGAGHEPVVAGVGVRRRLGHQADEPVERLGRDALEPRVGGAVVAHAVDDVDPVVLRGREHLGDDLGRVLQVGVEGDDVVAEGADEPGGDRRLVPGVGAQAHDAQLRPLAVVALEQRGRQVLAAVVDRDDLVGRVHGVEERSEPLDEEGEHLLLVVHRDDHGQLRNHAI